MIRTFIATDFPRILEIYTLSKLDELRFEAVEFEFLPLEKDAKRLSALRESDIYVYEDETILGYGAMFQQEIRALFVCPSARGEGVGKLMLEFLLAKVSGQAKLFVAKSNWPAIKFYQKFGFETTKEFIAEYNGTPVQAIEMVCSNKKC
ncbi:GNAT family N-acetyltransferase [Microbulbifer sp. DLAB2-AF]|uniref:GNAT family N-acetyltransferase n=1 Tax=Microbulbifer sp. DLAB2-AF TaxID=3243395 RepID=UPI00403A62C9